MWKQGCSRLPRTSLKHKKDAILRVLWPWQAAITTKKFDLLFFEILVFVSLTVLSKKRAKNLNNSLFRFFVSQGWRPFQTTYILFYVFQFDRNRFKTIYFLIFPYFGMLSWSSNFRVFVPLSLFDETISPMTKSKRVLSERSTLQNMSFAPIERIKYRGWEMRKERERYG